MVTNPPPGGGTSNQVNFAVNNAVPAISGLSPAAMMVGAAAETLTIEGSGFLSSSTVTYKGIAHAARFVSTTQLNIGLSASDQATLGSYAVVVTNPSPGGGLSNSAQFTLYSGFVAPTWQILGPSAIPNAHACDNANETNLLAAGKMQAFAINLAQPKVMYAGGGIGPGDIGPASDAGVYESPNGGATWVQSNNGLTNTYVDALWMNQNNTSDLVASTWLDGIFVSSDGGSTWSNVYSAQTAALAQIGSSLYAATANGVAVSNDSGATWTLADSTSTLVRAIDGVGAVVYAGLADGSVITQQSSGGPWNQVLAPGTGGAKVEDMAVNPTNSQQVIVVIDNDAGQLTNVITSDGGSTWATWSSPATGGLCNSGGPALVVAFDTVNPQIIYVDSGGQFYTSTNGGTSWTGQHLFEDMKLIRPLAGQLGVVVAGGDQGIYMSQDAGNSWTTLNGNLTTSLTNMIAVNGSEIKTTVQDFSPTTTFDGGSTWLQLSDAGF